MRYAALFVVCGAAGCAVYVAIEMLAARLQGMA